MPSDKTLNLELPYIYTNQAQKEVSVNEALTILDSVWNTGAISKALATPPGSPAVGDLYIIAASPTGAWAGKANYVTYYNNGWRFVAPKEGLRLWVNNEDLIYVYNGTAWVQAEGIPTQVSLLGINATADATNKLAVASAAVLFNHNGAGTQVKLNKNTSADTASFLYQDNFSGRAEIGLTGDDDFHFKVSPDGTTWNDSIIIDKTTGNVSLNSHKITNLTDPTSAQDAATKAYVDSVGGGGGGVSDGDKGDITVSGSGATWTIDNNAITTAKINNDAVTYAKIQNVSAADKILGRSTAGAGDVEEITCTAAGRALLDDADATAQRTTLGLGTAATQASTAFAAATHTHAASDVTSGTFADARIAASNVTQHQSSLSIASSQVTGTKTSSYVSDFTAAVQAISNGWGKNLALHYNSTISY